MRILRQRVFMTLLVQRELQRRCWGWWVWSGWQPRAAWVHHHRCQVSHAPVALLRMAAGASLLLGSLGCFAVVVRDFRGGGSAELS